MENYIPMVFGFLIAIPVAHFLLHALLKYWQKHIFAFYTTATVFFLFLIYMANLVIPTTDKLFHLSEILITIATLLIFLSIVVIFFSMKSLGIKRFLLLAVLNPKIVQQKVFYPGLYKFFPHPAYLAYFVIATSSFLILPNKETLYFWLLFTLTMPLLIILEEHELISRTNKTFNK